MRISGMGSADSYGEPDTLGVVDLIGDRWIEINGQGGRKASQGC